MNQNSPKSNGGGSKNLSRAHSADPEMEKLAADVAEKFATYCAKLKDLKPEIEKIHAWFKSIKGSQTLAGCRSFKQFCEQKLHRTEQAVYAMLGDYSQKDKKTGASGEKKNVPQQAAPHRSLVLADEDVESMRTGCNAAVRHFEAQERGDKVEAKKAKQEFLEISKAESLKSVILGDQPNYRMLLIDLLSDVEKVGDKLPASLTRKCQAIRRRLGIDGASFGVKPEDRTQPKPEQQPRTAEPKATDADAQAKAPVAETEQANTKANGNGKAGFPMVVNGLHITQRKDCKFVVFDPAREESNTLAICAELEQAIAAARKKKPEQAQSAQADSASA